MFDICGSLVHLQLILIKHFLDLAEVLTVLEFDELLFGSQLRYLDHGLIISSVNPQQVKRIIVELDLHRVQIVEAHPYWIELIDFLPELLVIVLLFYILQEELIQFVLKYVDLQRNEQYRENGIRVVPDGKQIKLKSWLLSDMSHLQAKRIREDVVYLVIRI